MKIEVIENYILTHRKRAGLSQGELGHLIGYGGEGSVSRHERSKIFPPLAAAMSYEVIFGVPVSKLFPGLRITVEQAVQERVSALERELQQKSADSSGGMDRHAQKLAWLDARRAVSKA